MKRGIKLFFLFCLSSMMCISLLPSTIYAQEEDTQTADEESSDSSELPKSSNMAPVYHFSLDKFLTEDEIEAAKLKAENPYLRSRVTFADILYEATKYEGLPYVWGGRYPSQGGFDCAGLCMYVFNQVCGTNFDLVNTNAAMLYTSHCTPVSESEAQPGDLVFFKGTYEHINYISHVGIYCGNGVMFNAGDPIGYGYVHDVINMNGAPAEVLYGRVNGVNVVGSQTGWSNINGNWYYFDEDGNQAFGWQTINDKLYYFNQWGRMVSGWTLISGNWYYFDVNDGMQKGWILDNSYYLDENGVMLSGWQNIDGDDYFFNGSGYKLRNCWVGNNYLLEDGKMAKDQWIGDCYVDENGLWVPSLHLYEWKTVDGKKKCYSNKTNSIVTDQMIEIDGSYYYFDSEGDIKTGFVSMDDKTYYFDQDGKMVTGWNVIDGSKYFFGVDGVMKTAGWQQNYYLDADGKMLTKAFTPDGYYVGNDGAYLTNSWFKHDGKDYYVNGYGHLVKNAWSGVYYLGEDGVMLTNAFTPDGYYVGKSGAYLTNSWFKHEGKDYYVNASGKLVKNQWVGEYYLDANGDLVTNDWVGSYYVDENGLYVRNSMTPDEFYCGANGVYVTNRWVKYNGKDYYMNAYGKMAKAIWQGNYYLGNDGFMLTNTFTPDGFYVGSDGAWSTSHWVFDGQWWYRHYDGTYKTNDFETIGNQTYYFDKKGYMVTGWKKINGKDYFFNASGALLKSTYTPDKFYVGADGAWQH